MAVKEWRSVVPEEAKNNGEPQANENTVQENQPKVTELQTKYVYGLATITEEGEINLVHSARGRRGIYSSIGHAKAARTKKSNQGLRIVAFESIGVVQEDGIKT